MFLLFIITLMLIIYFICMEFDEPTPSEVPLTGECPGCAEKVVSGWLICPKCQTLLREVCPTCNNVRYRWHNFCPSCGHLIKRRLCEQIDR